VRADTSEQVSSRLSPRSHLHGRIESRGELIAGVLLRSGVTNSAIRVLEVERGLHLNLVPVHGLNGDVLADVC